MLSLENLGICSWSLQPNNPDELLAGLSQLGMKKTQIALNPMREDLETWRFTGARVWEAGVQMVSGMIETLGDDYTSPQSIRETGGVVSDENWEQDRQNIRTALKLASSLDISMVTMHAGFVPQDEEDSRFDKMIERIDDIARLADEILDDGWLLLETGQETAKTIANFHAHLLGENIGINFDPANMILYGMDHPIEALSELYPYVKQIHLKDALPPKESGQWGAEVPLGRGAVDWPMFFRYLNDRGYAGNLLIEREVGDERMEDLKSGIEFVSQTLQDLEN